MDNQPNNPKNSDWGSAYRVLEETDHEYFFKSFQMYENEVQSAAMNYAQFAY
jgi:hypothetical protein